MKARAGLLMCVCGLAIGCADAGTGATDNAAVGTAEQAAYPSFIVDLEPWVTVVLKGLSTTNYRDVASSASSYYVLTDKGIKVVAHTKANQIPTAKLTTTIALNTIDYVDTKWVVIGARSKNGSTPAQLVLNATAKTPTTVNLPTTITTVYSIEGKTSTVGGAIQILLETDSGSVYNPYPVIHRFTYSGGSLTEVSQFNYGPYTAAFAQLDVDNYVSINTYPYTSWHKQTFSTGNSNIEALKLDIDNGDYPASGFDSGLTTGMHYHGFQGTLSPEVLTPSTLDAAFYNNGTTLQYVALVRGSSGVYDLVRFDASSIVFNKTPDLDLGYWNNDLIVEMNNNCYNYATNRKTNNFAQTGYGAYGRSTSCPGRICDGTVPYWTTPANVAAAAVADGLVSVPDPGPGLFPTVPEGMTLVAAICGEKCPGCPSFDYQGGDYHWFRRDSNGYWSYKDSSYEASNIGYCNDDPDCPRLITDPRDTNQWPIGAGDTYDTFVGFFLANDNYYQGQGLTNANGFSRIYYPPAAAAASASTSKAASTTLSAAPATNALEITVSLYSGRPNPVLTIQDSATIDRIKALYAQSSKISAKPAVARHSRYSGLYVVNSGKVAGLPDLFFVHGTAITAQMGSGSTLSQSYLVDSASQLETYLLDAAATLGTITQDQRNSIQATDNL